jgi:hypothetical protein
VEGNAWGGRNEGWVVRKGYIVGVLGIIDLVGVSGQSEYSRFDETGGHAVGE